LEGDIRYGDIFHRSQPELTFREVVHLSELLERRAAAEGQQNQTEE
jgi:hypothetical protein